MSTVFKKSYSQAEDGAVPTTDLAIVGTSTDGTVYHWVFYLRLARATRSVVFDMSPGLGEPPTGVLLVSSVPRPSSDGPEVLEYAFEPPAPLTPDAFLAFITERGYDRFRFTREGTGCRNWCKDVLLAMQEEGRAPAGVVDAFQAWLKTMSDAVGVERIPMPGVRGTFY